MFALFDDIEVKCGFIGKAGRQRTVLAEMLLENEILLEPAMNFDALDTLCAQGFDAEYDYDFMFIDIDSLGGITAIIDRLAGLRLNCPSLPVIMISSEFASDDFDSTRRALGDISLRSPIRYSSLELSLFEAMQNNKDWQNSISYYRQDVAA
ncbi:hypothetical protein [Planktotalea arctica]|uniref:hypothetical protein n=1 Tax=Planktotalea arctica TaxID=1481893 RepID=UPI000A171800|nr:hypothetical protein [Planktotalea arctica]